ncbi:MAG TPA: DMT family transporter [Kiloniellales bacterium]|jgi:drug/metabolite transporter (DMT)-like permease
MPTSEALPVGASEEAGRYKIGVICLVAATFFTSLAGILLRLIDEAGGWQILFYRSLAFIVVMLLFIGYRHRGRTVAAFTGVGRAGLAISLCLTAAFILFVFAILQTTVASVVFTVSLSPFFAALFAWLILREAVAPATLVAMVLSLAGIGLMFGDGLAAGTSFGNLLALGTCLCYSGALVAMRKGRATDMLPAVCLAGVGTAVIAAVMAPDLGISRHDLGIAVVLGVLQLALQYILITTATRYVPAAEVALIGRLTLIMAPLWVWIGVGEVPSLLTLAGGAIILSAVTGQGLFALRRARRAAI